MSTPAEEELMPAVYVAAVASAVVPSSGPVAGVVVSDPHAEALHRFDTRIRQTPTVRYQDHRLLVHGRIATGMWSHVYAAQDADSHEAFALKVIPRDSAAARGDLDVLRRLNHKHIVRMDEEFPLSVDHTAFLCTKMEFCGKGTLRQLLKERRAKGKGLPTATVLRYLTQMADALAYIHKNGLLHGDLRSENCLLTWNDDVKLSAFGNPARLLRNRPSGLQLTITGGCRTYAPPEWQDSVQLDRPLTALEIPEPSYDMWALGCVLTEMVTLRLIFGDRVAHFEAVASDPVAMDALEAEGAAAHHGRFAPLLAGLLARDPTERLDAEELRRRLSGTLGVVPATWYPTALIRKLAAPRSLLGPARHRA